MKFLMSRWVMMLGVALVIVAGSMVLAPAVAKQVAPQAAGNGSAVLGGGSAPVGVGNGYTDRLVADMQRRAAADPRDSLALSQLGLGYLQKARETNDPSYYTKAEEALDKALALKPGDYDSTAAMGSLELSRHQFSKALEWGTKARGLNPNKGYAYGVMGDAQIELGKYDEAVNTFQKMVDLHPDLSSYSRVSYARELYGDLAGAIEAMQQAVDAGSPAAENTAWVRVQLGNLYFNSGRLESAEREYNHALYAYPGYLHATAGLAQVRAAQGRVDEAIKLYKASIAGVPLPQYVVALGDLYASKGDTASAKEQYDLVLFTYRLFEVNGVNADIEKAAFLADQDQDAEQAVKLAQEAAKGRQDVHTLDTLAWSLYRVGRYGEALAAEKNAMHLGTQNAMFYFHAGMIYSKLGDQDNARANLQKALKINPHFSVKYAPQAMEELGK
ncbi:MAG: tetratricopeptide repeat protein [Chloroflexia bacterium]